MLTLFHIVGNKIGEIGVEAFLISIQRQAEVSSSSGKPTGLMRLSMSVSNSAEHSVCINLCLSKLAVSLALLILSKNTATIEL